MMSDGSSFRAFACGVRAAGLAAIIHLASFIGHGATPTASVVSVEATRVADLVLLSHGLDAGLRQGMVCKVTRGTTEIAEVLLVESRTSCSAALILNVASKQSIRSGDVAAVKVLKT